MLLLLPAAIVRSVYLSIQYCILTHPHGIFHIILTVSCSLYVSLIDFFDQNLHTVANAQVVQRIQDLQLVGGGAKVGYIQATVLLSDGSTATGPICGTVNSATALVACRSNNLHGLNASSIRSGTVSSIGWVWLVWLQHASYVGTLTSVHGQCVTHHGHI